VALMGAPGRLLWPRQSSLSPSLMAVSKPPRVLVAVGLNGPGRGFVDWPDSWKRSQSRSGCGVRRGHFAVVADQCRDMRGECNVLS
jgi:hypothetical protein